MGKNNVTTDIPPWQEEGALRAAWARLMEQGLAGLPAPTGPEVLVAASGGADSSAVAALLVALGLRVSLVMLDFHEEGACGAQVPPETSRIQLALIAERLGLETQLLDARARFKSQVVEPFVAAYLAGLTPNPCVMCNPRVKIAALLAEADRRGVELVATGHYARLENDEGRIRLLQGRDSSKDQSYVLHRLGQKELSRLVLPAGIFRKADLVTLAVRLGLVPKNQPESMEVCFLGEGDYRSLLEQRARPRRGPLVHISGRILGAHTGYWRFTVGQRKGLNLAWPEPLYVVSVDPVANSVVVAERSQAVKNVFYCEDLIWTSGEAPSEPFGAEVAIRYRARLVGAEVAPFSAGQVCVTLKEPLLGVAPGQSAVFYVGQEVLGGGLISTGKVVV